MNAQDVWNIAFTQLEMQLDRASFDTWLRDATFLRVEEGKFVIGVRNSYARDMLQHRLYRNIRRVVSDVFGESVEIRFEVRSSSASESPTDDMPLFRLLAQQPQEAAAKPEPLHKQVARPQRPAPPDTDLNPRFTFERFIVGNENPIIYPAARAVADHPGTTYNPFLVYGGVGLGKTHILQAIAHACQMRGLRVVYISSEAFTNDLVDAIRNRTTAMFRERYRQADVLLVDDIQFIAGKENTQEEFFHTFNALHMYNKQIVLASDRHPSRLDGVVDRLRSRFQSGLIAELPMPELETRRAIVEMWANERGIAMPPHVTEMVANRARTNIRELESMFNQVVARVQFGRQPMTWETAETVLDGYHRPRNPISLTRVLDITAQHHGLTVHDLVGPRRSSTVNQARQVAMYLARETTNASLPQIGEAFGGRKHSTVLYSCNKVAEDLISDDALRSLVACIREKLMDEA